MKKLFFAFLLVSISLFGSNTEVVFSQDRSLQKVFASKLKSTSDKIIIVTESFTNKKIAKVLATAFQRGVRVELYVGKLSKKKNSATNLLKDEGVSITEVPSLRQNFCLVDNMVILGSYPLGRNENRKKIDQLVFLHERKSLADFEKQVLTLKGGKYNSKKGKTKPKAPLSFLSGSKKNKNKEHK